MCVCVRACVRACVCVRLIQLYRAYIGLSLLAVSIAAREETVSRLPHIFLLSREISVNTILYIVLLYTIHTIQQYNVQQLSSHLLRRKKGDGNLNILDAGVESQAARQGLAVLMASAVVVLKYEASTLRQRHNFISIDLTFGVSDYVREVTSPDNVGLGPMSDRDATWGQHIRIL